MQSAFLKYLKNLLIFSGIIGLIALILTFVLKKAYVSPALPFLFPFFIATSLLSFYYLLRSTEKRFIKFINTFMLTIIFKLVIYIGLMVIYVFTNRGDAIPFMLGFLILYLCYTVFDTASILKYTKPSAPENIREGSGH